MRTGPPLERKKRLAIRMVDTRQLNLLKKKKEKKRLRNMSFEKKSLLELRDTIEHNTRGANDTFLYIKFRKVR